jgi:hypothetical protein
MDLLRLDSSTASIVSSAGPKGLANRQKRPVSQYLQGFIGDGPGPYNASFWLEGAMPEPVIVNVNIAQRG